MGWNVSASERDIKKSQRYVLEESGRQTNQQAYNPEVISMLSRQATRRSRRFARLLGIVDATVVGMHPSPTSKSQSPWSLTFPNKKRRLDFIP